MFKKTAFLTAITAFALLLPFFNACMADNPYVNRSQLMLVSEESELQMGEQGRDEILKTATISHNKKMAQKIVEVGKKLAHVANQPNYTWEFYLIESNEVNAFCLPGGKVFVYTGILNFVANDDELATIMGHEIGHAIARHGAERMSMSMIQDTGQKATSILAEKYTPKYAYIAGEAYNIGTNYGLMLPYSREQELEADKIGIELMYKAGYNPKYALSFWQKMAQQGKGGIEFFSTHPSDSTRIKNIKAHIQNLK